MTFKQFLITTLCAAAILMGAVAMAHGQERRREYITAVAQGTAQQLGQIVNVTFIINEVSTADDQKILIDAFRVGGSRGLSNAVDKMSSKGRISITGTIGYDVNYIREFILPDGSRKIRFVTDRPIRFREAWSSTRSIDYSLSMGEIIIRGDRDSNSGTIMPIAKFRLDKEKELSIETFRNPWKLLNIKAHD
ncbi:MAG: hypothetical protein DMF63_05550 [Acidobacteria bacterium]|nr:MAG: hypothetical protein DMF63_05550 [Acidobacteriota bacterium]